MRVLLLSALVFFIFSISNNIQAQEKRIYIDQNGQVIDVKGDPPSESFYIDNSGHLRKIDGSGLYIFDGSNVIPHQTSKDSRGGEAHGSAKTTSKYYIGEDMQMHEVINGWPERSFHTNEYGKLLENKGKKKPKNSTN